MNEVEHRYLIGYLDVLYFVLGIMKKTSTVLNTAALVCQVDDMFKAVNLMYVKVHAMRRRRIEEEENGS